MHATRTRPAWIGLATTLLVIALAVAVPALTGWSVHSLGLAPLHGPWHPRIGPGTPAAILLAVLAVVLAPRIARWRWWQVQLTVFLGGIAWMVSLATVDGWAGIRAQLGSADDYLPTARTITDVSAMLHEFVSRIPFSAAPDNWAVHVAGHPPGAVLFFVLLVRLGLGSALASGFVIVVIAATTAVAVLTTLRLLGAEQAARRCAPFLTIGPAAIWMAATADAMFAATAAWALCCLAVCATSRGRWRTAAWGLASGVLFGATAMLSYGLALIAVIAVAVLVVARTWRPLPWVLLGAAAVIGGFALAGFAWWEALPVLSKRYWGGLASARPGSYWIWGDLAAFAISAGPLAGAAVAMAGTTVVARLRQTISRPTTSRSTLSQPGITRPTLLGPIRADVVVGVLTLAALGTVLLADVSGMSRAEVERIWLPFVPWILVGTALLPERWRRWGLGFQAVFALLVEHLIKTGW